MNRIEENHVELLRNLAKYFKDSNTNLDDLYEGLMIYSRLVDIFPQNYVYDEEAGTPLKKIPNKNTSTRNGKRVYQRSRLEKCPRGTKRFPPYDKKKPLPLEKYKCVPVGEYDKEKKIQTRKKESKKRNQVTKKINKTTPRR